MNIRKVTGRESLFKPPLTEKLRSGCVVLNKGEEVGEHITKNREEILVILEGSATVECEGERVVADKQTSIYIPKNKKHNVWNLTSETLKYIYIVVQI